MGDTATNNPADGVRVFNPAVPVIEIARNPANPRKLFGAEALRELADSIKTHGLLEPIVVRRADVIDPDEPHIPCRYELIIGERRWRAARLAGLETIAATVYSELSADKALEMALIENLQREDMNSMEEAEGFSALVVHGLTQAQIAERVHKSRSRISNALRLVELPEAIKEHVRAGRLSQKHAEGLLRFRDFPHVMTAIADLAVRKGASAAELAKGIPFQPDLERAKVIEQIVARDLGEAGMDYHDAKTFRALKELPFIYVEKSSSEYVDDKIFALDVKAWGAWLAPRIAEHEERNRKRLEEHQAEVERQKAKAAGKKGPGVDLVGQPVDQDKDADAGKGAKLVDLDKLGYGKYVVLSSLQATIRKLVPIEKIELGKSKWMQGTISAGSPVEFTRDVSFVENLQRQASAKRNKVQRAKLDVAYECAVETIKAIKKVESDDLANVAGWVFTGYRSDKVLDEALKELAIEPTSELHKLDPVDLLRAILLGKVRQEWEKARNNASEMPSDLENYAGKWEKAYEKRVELEKKEAEKAAAAAKAEGAKAEKPSKAGAGKGSKAKAAKAAKQPAKGKGADRDGEAEISAETEKLVIAGLAKGDKPGEVAKVVGISLPAVWSIRRDAIAAGKLSAKGGAQAAAAGR